METFREWKERTLMNAYYKVGGSILLTFFAVVFHAIDSKANPEVGFKILVDAGLFAAIVLWFWGCLDYVRSKGLTLSHFMLSLLYIPGFMILVATPEDAAAFGRSHGNERGKPRW